MLRDIAILTGGEVVSEGNWPQPKDIKREWLGGQVGQGPEREHDHRRRRRQFQGDPETRIGSIRKQIEDTTSSMIQGKLNERLASFPAASRPRDPVGAATETEMKQRKFKWKMPARHARGRRGRDHPAAARPTSTRCRQSGRGGQPGGDEKTGALIILRALEEFAPDRDQRRLRRGQSSSTKSRAALRERI
jgi:chaperonin GroEL